MQKDILIIGIDGGATKVAAYEIVNDQYGYFLIGKHSAERHYADYPEFDKYFSPVPLKIQLDEMPQNLIVTPAEKKQSVSYLQAFMDVISEVAQKANNNKILIGLGMPGLKTADKRGIAALANGPRMPFFCDILEEKLHLENIQLISRIHKLGSDADYCGIGEEYASDGSFRNVTNAYYLGGGTGVADAMKLNGWLIPFDDAKSWIAKTWEFKTSVNSSMEKFISAKGIQQLYSEKTGISMDELAVKGIFGLQILEKALKGEEIAKETVDQVVYHLSRLLFERIYTLFFGWGHHFELINPAKTIESHHQYTGTLLDRIVIGQRLGDWLSSESGTQMLLQPLQVQLAALIRSVKDQKFCNHYLPGGELRNDLIIHSTLRVAPALGAGADAFVNYKNNSLC